MSSKNNFDLLRFIFAFVVFLVHAQTLTQNPSLAHLTGWLSSELAVQGFFVISGYLVYASHQNSHSLQHYLQKRVRRIYPAYLAVIVVCALFGTALTSRDFGNYISLDLLKYLVSNLLFLNFLTPNLPGVFENNSLQAVNGALWTLKIEVMFYLSVPLIAWAVRRYGFALTASLLYAASLMYSLSMEHLHVKSGHAIFEILARQFPGQLTYFLAGMALFQWREALPRLCWWALPALAVLLLVRDPTMRLALAPVALAIVVIYFATTFLFLGNFARYGDLSYGVYIVHFPILQAMISLKIFPPDGFQGFVVAGALVISSAFLSWHLIEKRWLQKSSHYILSARGQDT